MNKKARKKLLPSKRFEMQLESVPLSPLQEIIDKAIVVYLKSCDINSKDIEYGIERPTDEKHGDYSTNLALVLASKLKKAPLEIAKEFVDSLTDWVVTDSPIVQGEVFSECKTKKNEKARFNKVEVVKPGFVNFYISVPELLLNLEGVLSEKEKYGSSDFGNGKTVIVDYSAPNIAKRFGIGHLRSTVIGQALYNIYHFLGWNTIGDNHLGDWGTQFGKLIVAIKAWATKPVDKLTMEDLQKLYIRFHEEVEEDETLADKARKAFKNLESGGKEEREIWEKLVKQSLKEFDRIYDVLGVKIDEAYGESFYQEIMLDVIQEAKDKGLVKTSQGALIFPLTVNDVNEEMPPGLMRKSDGATTYFTRDLATIKFREDKWDPDLYIYEVGVEQKLHFQQVFMAANKLGWGESKNFKHVAHGLVRSEKGKMSTRRGNIVKLEDVLEKAVDLAKQFNDDIEVATKVGIGAVKYNDLKHSPHKGYKFSWDKVVTLDGNSGPYLQYTYARCKSILRKATKAGLSYTGVADENLADLTKGEGLLNDWYHLSVVEVDLLRLLFLFPEIVLEAGLRFAPNIVAEYLYSLASKFNLFYKECPVLKIEGDDKGSMVFRLAITKASSIVLQSGLNLLGIDVVEEM